MTDVKETKAQRAERLKRELNPWEAYAEIERFSREGWDSIPPEWWTYFRWWGIYSQGDGVGAVGGTGGEGKASRHLMLRVRITNCALSSHQLRALADLSERYARSIADVTVRQNVQLHWLTIEALPEIVQTLWRTGLTSLGACGDVPRNVTGCPLAGVDADEIVDASPLVLEATRLLNGNADFYNLPRKFKASITGCRVWCSYPEINDVGVTALRHPASGEIGYSVRVGGGLATDPHLALDLDVFLRSHQVVPVVRAVAEIFRDSDVLRQHREKARLKFLFLHHGWTAAQFRDVLQARAGFTLDRAPWHEAPEDVYRDHVGVHPQRQPGLVYAGIAVPRGRITHAELRAVAEGAERFASGEVRSTNMQNLLIPGVRRDRAAGLVRVLEAAGLQC